MSYDTDNSSSFENNSSQTQSKEKKVKRKRKRSQKRTFVCAYDDCLKSFTSSQHLKRHEDAHEGVFPCTKENCGMQFKTKFTLKKHIDNIHLKKMPKKYKCDDCGEEFNKHNWLTSHRYKHTGVKPYKCSFDGCEARFLVHSKLKRHMKIHSGYTCTQENCSQQFSKWSLLRSHLAHAHPPIFKCQYCEKSFSRSNNLKSHMEMHNFDREVFLCPKPDCSRFYFSKRNLTFHLKHYHDKRPFICSEKNCFKAFKSEELLNRHFSWRHDPSRRIRKKKKSKPKPSLAAQLAGLAPKKWQVQDESVTAVCSGKSHDDGGPIKSKDIEVKPQSPRADGNKVDSQLTTNIDCDEHPHLLCTEETKQDQLIEEDYDCRQYNDILSLLTGVVRQKTMDFQNIDKKTKCISIA